MGRQNNQLTRAGSTAISKTQEQLCDSSILTCVTMTAQMLKTEVTTQEQAMWVQLLRPYPLPLVQKSFHQFLKRGLFFPKPAEIISIVESYERENRDRLAEEQRKAERAELKAAQDAGETWGWADVVKKFSSVMSAVTRRKIAEGKTMPRAVDVNDERVIVITPAARQRVKEQAAEALRRFGRK